MSLNIRILAASMAAALAVQTTAIPAAAQSAAPLAPAAAASGPAVAGPLEQAVLNAASRDPGLQAFYAARNGRPVWSAAGAPCRRTRCSPGSMTPRRMRFLRAPMAAPRSAAGSRRPPRSIRRGGQRWRWT